MLSDAICSGVLRLLDEQLDERSRFGGRQRPHTGGIRFSCIRRIQVSHRLPSQASPVLLAGPKLQCCDDEGCAAECCKLFVHKQDSRITTWHI